MDHQGGEKVVIEAKLNEYYWLYIMMLISIKFHLDSWEKIWQPKTCEISLLVLRNQDSFFFLD